MVNGVLVEERLTADPLVAVSAVFDALPALPAIRVRPLYPIGSALEDAGAAMLLAYAVPAAILLVGAPIALLARLTFEIVSRLFG